MIRASIRLRLVAWYLAILTTGMLLLGTMVWVLLRHAMLESLDESLIAQKASFVHFLEQESHGADLAALREEAREYSSGLPAGYSLRVRAPDGTLLYVAPDPRSIPDGQHVVRGDSSVLGQRLSIELGVSPREVFETLTLLRTILLSSIPFVLIVATAGGWWISSKALKPVDTLTAAAEAIGVGDLSRRLPVPATGDELQRLSEAWNRMLDRIATSVEHMKRFTADAAHELRNPVTIIFSTAELALRRARDTGSYLTALESIRSETGHLIHLVEELMWLARTDGRSLDLSRQDVSVDELASDVFRAASPLADSRSISLEAQHTGMSHATIRCELRSMRRCLMILLDNAIKFTPSGGRVRVHTVSKPAGCRFEVHDNGPGIAEDHLPHVFERFYQADKSRTTSGFGLGLSIAKGIVEAHDGLIGVINKTGGGCCFYVELPVKDARRSDVMEFQMGVE